MAKQPAKKVTTAASKKATPKVERSKPVPSAKKSALAKTSTKTTSPKSAQKHVEKKTTPAKSASKSYSPAKTAGVTLQQALDQLKAFGNEKMRAYNKKNGAGDNQFGVKLGDIRKVADKIKKNHALALELWQTKNIDAQLLATLLMKPDQLSAKELDQMVRSVTFTYVGDWLHSYVTKEHPEKESLRVQWMKTNDPMAARAGWRLTAGRAAKNPDGLDLKGLLDRIESEMATANPLIQWTMNMCLAEIGIHHEALRARALAIGEKLGIYRDYPVSKGCTSPFSPIWINAMVKRK